MMAQMPRFRKTMQAEKEVVDEAVSAFGFDLIISDNRYGCWSNKAYAVLVTHQLNILAPRHYTFLSPAIDAYHRRLINRFDLCWVPDVIDNGLAGKLSAPNRNIPRCPVEYIGHLSRFSPISPAPLRYQVACILSGPEPQRSIFEGILERQLSVSGMSYLIVAGVPASPGRHDNNHRKGIATGEELQTILAASECVVARSGYSTVMDLAATGKKAILVPTPGQPEQEYLAHRLRAMGICFTQAQDQFNIGLALERSRAFSGFAVPRMFEARIQQVVEGLFRHL
jgi:hypothetical protein